MGNYKVIYLKKLTFKINGINKNKSLLKTLKIKKYEHVV